MLASRFIKFQHSMISSEKFSVLAGPSYSEEPGPLLWHTPSQGEEDWALLLSHLVGELSSGVEVHQQQHTCAHFNIMSPIYRT